MRNFFLIFVYAIKQKNVWKFNLSADFLLSMAYFLFQTEYFSRIFGYSENIAGWTISDMKLIFFSYLMISFISGAFSESIEVFFRKIHLGVADLFLTKPINAVTIMVLRWCNPMKLLFALFLAIYCAIFSDFIDFSERADGSVVGYWIVIFFASLANCVFYILFYLPTLLGWREPPVDYMHSEIYQLSMLPINLYPRVGFAALALLMPISCGASVAVYVFIFGLGNVVILFLAGCFTLFFITALVFRISWRSYSSLGG